MHVMPLCYFMWKIRRMATKKVVGNLLSWPPVPCNSIKPLKTFGGGVYLVMKMNWKLHFVLAYKRSFRDLILIHGLNIDLYPWSPPNQSKSILFHKIIDYPKFIKIT